MNRLASVSATDYDKRFLRSTPTEPSPLRTLWPKRRKSRRSHFSIFINFDESLISRMTRSTKEEERVRKILNTSVEELELTVRSSNCSEEREHPAIGDLDQKETEEEIAQDENFGKKSLSEIKEN
jgi:DNA-directed RNA polymerase subunit alpha